MASSLLDKIQSAPILPGCYIYRNADGVVLYVGKAKNLRKRVRQYFDDNIVKEPKIEVMVPQIADVEFVIVKNEDDAFVLESSLIKKYRPKYNKLLKDDKQYAWIKITKEPIPRILRERDNTKHDGRYFGPFPDGGAARRTLGFLRKLFPYRVCSKPMYYGENEKRKKFINSDNTIRYSERSRTCLDYHLGLCNGPCDNLVSSEVYNENVGNIRIFLEGKHFSLLKSLREQMEEYSNNLEFEKASMVRDQITELRYISRKLFIRHGEDEEIVREKRIREAKKTAVSLLSKLGIKWHGGESLRIECYDISNIQGTNPIASMVVMLDGIPANSHYRFFNIRGKATPDDFEMMREALTRRFKHRDDNRKSIDESFSATPDLLIMDGGKGQLDAALGVAENLGFVIPIVGIAKREEEIFIKKDGKFKLIRLRLDSAELKLVQRIRDEAHRFAITRHRNLRSKKAFSNVLSDIRGVGFASVLKLQKRNLSVEDIKKMGVEELSAIVTKSVAVRIYEYFHPEYNTPCK